MTDPYDRIDPDWGAHPDANFYAVTRTGREVYCKMGLFTHADVWLPTTHDGHLRGHANVELGGIVDLTGINWTKTLRVRPGYLPHNPSGNTESKVLKSGDWDELMDHLETHLAAGWRRVKPDWSKCSPNMNYYALDADGLEGFYPVPPLMNEHGDCWMPACPTQYEDGDWVDDMTGIDWKESLRVRPGYQPPESHRGYETSDRDKTLIIGADGGVVTATTGGMQHLVRCNSIDFAYHPGTNSYAIRGAGSDGHWSEIKPAHGLLLGSVIVDEAHKRRAAHWEGHEEAQRSSFD